MPKWCFDESRVLKVVLKVPQLGQDVAAFVQNKSENDGKMPVRAQEERFH